MLFVGGHEVDVTREPMPVKQQDFLEKYCVCNALSIAKLVANCFFTVPLSNNMYTVSQKSSTLHLAP